MKPLSTLRRLVHNSDLVVEVSAKLSEITQEMNNINVRLDQTNELIRSRVNLYPPACASVDRRPLSELSLDLESDFSQISSSLSDLATSGQLMPIPIGRRLPIFEVPHDAF